MSSHYQEISDIIKENPESISDILTRSITLKDFFGRTKDSIEGVPHLPAYQRPYCWGEKQVRQLIGDLQQYSKTKSRIAFYLGSIVLHRHKNENGQWVLDIIDGQQRLTTMAILCMLLNRKGGTYPLPTLQYRAPASHEQIRHNFALLEQLLPKKLDLDLAKINITVIITQSEDEAWRFFQTLNTGGVRLSGVDIIKAYHLRAIAPPLQPDHYARLWESTGGSLDPTVQRLLCGRFWTHLHTRSFNRRNPRNDIIAEFAERTQPAAQDNAYRLAICTHGSEGNTSFTLSDQGYALRQPLNGGVNTIHYLIYFSALYKSLFLEDSPDEDVGHKLYKEIVQHSAQSHYLRELYETALLLYASRFGTGNLPAARLWLFRMIFSLRMIKNRVTEAGVRNFCMEWNILDHIAFSFNHAELMAYLQSYTYDVNKDGLEDNGVKKRFVMSVYDLFGSSCHEEENNVIHGYDNFLTTQFNNHISSTPSRTF
ncbi:DUF262 domain-containing protein [Komagataeibacter europaeus]|uniref:DUF262 domain-containing protein n=1 Tax=Komagataeibacter europaeus TaxID=33995 RepID=UPI0002E091CD|nr:DUF262 domain-containing protein [Komagataeibacter europaeus]